MVISPSVITGSLKVPASKSSMQRACALALLHHGKTIIDNAGVSNDDLAALEIIKSLGAKISQHNTEVIIESEGINPVNSSINCGESGLSFRMFGVIAALCNGRISINGSGSLLQRPNEQLHQILQTLRVKINSPINRYPLEIEGPMQVKDVDIDGSKSSQYLTGVLIAFASKAIKHVTITVSNLASKPYIDLTLSMLKHWGYDIIHNNYRNFFINPVTENKGDIFYTVESDWSSASFLIVAAAITGEIKLSGLDMTSTQADRAVLEVVKSAGAVVNWDNDLLTINKNDLRSFSFDATDCPDLFPPLAALAACCAGESKISGVHRLKHKESDRAVSIIKEFGKMNVQVSLDGDTMIISGGNQVTGAEVHSHHDHRIAMACAVLALKANGDTTIEQANAVAKSYPGFFTDLQQLGVRVNPA